MKAEIYNTSFWVPETEPKTLKKVFDEILHSSGFTILKFIEHDFEPVGYTALWLLSESHFALHTFPEESKTYIELSSCNELYFDSFVSNCAWKKNN